MFVQDVAVDALPQAPGLRGVEESCPCPGIWGCDWDTDPADPDENFENGGKPYYQMVLGANSEALALYWSELMDTVPTMGFAEREAWCSETVSYWHRESATPYLLGYYTDWHEHWRISNVADLRIWYETEEASGGRGRWINATEIEYHDFELGVTVPVPGAYIAIAEYDDATDSYPDMEWSHSLIVDEMTVHRDGHGNVFQVEIDILEGNSGDRVRDDHHWDDLLTLTPQGSGWVSKWPGNDGVMNTADDVWRKVYGIGIDLDQFGQPYYDPARLHEVDHPAMLRAVLPSAVTTTDDDWDTYAVMLPWLIDYATMVMQGSGPTLKWVLNQGDPLPVPNGDPQTALAIPDVFVGQIIIEFPAPHPLPIEGLELTWGFGPVPVGYTVTFYNETQQGAGAAVPDLSNYPPPAGLPAFVPAVLDQAMTDVVAVELFFPSGAVPPGGAVLTEIGILFEGAPWEDAPSESVEVQRPAFVDVKPGSCPNSVNPDKKGVMPVAILGTFDLDVTAIDPASVLAGGVVAPLRWAYEDVATPFIGGAGGCHTLEGDGIVDLTLKYDAMEVSQALDLPAFGGQEVPLVFVGDIPGDGTVVLGEDWVRVLDR